MHSKHFKEDLGNYFYLPGNLKFKNNTATNQIMKHKLAVAIHRLLRGLSSIEDNRIIDVLDLITKLGSTESCVSMFDTWKSLSLFPFMKNSREQERVSKIISDRVETIIWSYFPFQRACHRVLSCWFNITIDTILYKFIWGIFMKPISWKPCYRKRNGLSYTKIYSRSLWCLEQRCLRLECRTKKCSNLFINPMMIL